VTVYLATQSPFTLSLFERVGGEGGAIAEARCLSALIRSTESTVRLRRFLGVV
jgi:hypothetical protein